MDDQNPLFVRQSDISILYVDDDESVRRHFSDYLNRRFEQVFLAEDGQQGWELFCSERPQIIITDICMPRMDGLEMVGKIRELDREVLIIVVTAYDDSGYLMRGINLGVTRYTLKPMRHEVMDEILLECVDIVQMRRERSEKEAYLERKIKEESAKRVMQERILLQQSRQAILGEMIGSITHQMKQPLSVLGMLSASLEDAFAGGELDGAYLEHYCAQVKKQLDHMAETITTFRNFLKPHSTGSAFSICDVLKEVHLLTLKMLSSQGVTLMIALGAHEAVRIQETHFFEEHKGELPLIKGVESEFKQVVMNLLVNSRDAFEMRKRQKREISIALRQEGAVCVMEYRDTGGGIDGAVMERLFEPYVSTKGEQGTGIGLYMVKQVLDRMGAEVVVKNEGEGALFLMRLPLLVEGD